MFILALHKAYTNLRALEREVGEEGYYFRTKWHNARTLEFGKLASGDVVVESDGG